MTTNISPNKYLIFGSTISQANNFLVNNILPNIPTDQIIRHTKSSYNHNNSILLKDGTIYQCVSASDNARGYKCDKVYISCDVDKEIVNNVIIRCLRGNGLDDEDRIIWY